MTGIVQAIEHAALPFVLGVQWHPEYLPQKREQRRIFETLLRYAMRAHRMMRPLMTAPPLLARHPRNIKGAHMAKQKRQPSNRPPKVRPPKREGEKAGEWNERDEELKRRFVDQSGIVAQDLPEAARGQNAVPDAHEMTRNLPHQHGGELGGEGGLRGDRNLSDADDHGGRKNN